MSVVMAGLGFCWVTKKNVVDRISCELETIRSPIQACGRYLMHAYIRSSDKISSVNQVVVR